MAMLKPTRSLVGIVAAISLAIVVMTTAALQSQPKIPATGKIRTVDIAVFSDPTCFVQLTSIDWGLISPGETKNLTIYVKSLSTVDAVLFLGSEDWVPSHSASFIQLSWNRAGTAIKAGEVVSALVSLRVDPAIQNVASFSFIMVFTATETG